MERRLINMNTGKEWTEEEIEILKTEWEKGAHNDKIGAILDRTENAVKAMATKLGLKRPACYVKKPRKFEDLTGKVFGRLTVLEYAGVSKYGQRLWKCECSCPEHNIVIRQELNLRRNSNSSCGCYNKEFCKENFSKQNTYDLSGKYGVGWTEEGEEFLFDLEDYDIIKEHYWRVSSYGYMQAVDKETHRVIMMHRLVMGISYNDDYNKICVDHIHGDDIRDNRKCNLRLATRTENAMNRRMQSNNTSGVTGVVWNNERNKWTAQIRLNGKCIRLGHFDNFDDAVAARKAGEEKYFGERSYDNSRNAVID